VCSGIKDLLRVNLNVGHEERVVVLADYPSQADWRRLARTQLLLALERPWAAKTIVEIARASFPWLHIEFWAYPIETDTGTEPPAEVLEKMLQAEIVIGVTSLSMLDTEARKTVTQRGTRVCSMLGFDLEMFYAGGPMAVDYIQMAGETQKLAALLTEAREARVASAAGTDITFDLSGRHGIADSGIYEEPGTWGALPAGEAYIVLDSLARGQLVIEPRWYPNVNGKLQLSFSKGNVMAVEGAGETAENMRRVVGLDSPGEEPAHRCRLAKFGIGTNPNARNMERSREREKIKGTVHFALTANTYGGGRLSVDQYICIPISRPNVWLDDRQVMESGAWLF
jgi:leucyl aminopeptidase (aminopeptidase T)